jgi:HK97 family phage prohead protease
MANRDEWVRTQDYLEVRQQGTIDANEKRIEGYAIIFNNWYDMGAFRERVLPSAVTPEFLKEQDVCAKWNHQNSTGILARSYKGKTGTLKLSVDEKGLWYSFPVKRNSPLHQEVYEMVKSGEIFSSSFSFVMKDSLETWDKGSDGKYERTIKGFHSLWDVSPVVTPANPMTTCQTRFYKENILPFLPPSEREKEAELDFNEKKRILDKIESDVKLEMAKREDERIAANIAKEKREAHREYMEGLKIASGLNTTIDYDKMMEEHREKKEKERKIRERSWWNNPKLGKSNIIDDL